MSAVSVPVRLRGDKKNSGIKEDGPDLMTLSYLSIEPTDEISGPSACHVEYIISFKIY